MKKISFLISFLLIVQMASAQWNVIGWNPYLQRDTSGDSTFVLSAPSRIAIQNGVANWTPSTSGGASYLVYTALLTQTGTSAPVANVYENTLGGAVTWSRTDFGQYTATTSGLFTDTKTFILLLNNNYNNNEFICRTNSINTVQLLSTSDTDAENPDWPMSIEIRVYPE